MPLPLTDLEVFQLNNDVLSAFSRMQMGDRLNVLGNPSGGADFYVNSNLSATAGDGSSWNKAFKTLAEALAASHALIATSNVFWAAENRIFYKGDSNTEVLTTLAQKTTIYGVGSGGGHRSKPAIVGEHIIGAVGYVNCNFVNMGFLPATNGGDLWTTPKELNGLKFFDCDFESENGAAIAGSALTIVGGNNMVIEGCKFGVKFTDSVIEFTASGASEQMIIRGNVIQGADKGIEFITGVSSSVDLAGPLVEGNTIHTTLICIEDADQSFVRVVKNDCITSADDGAAGVGIIKCNTAKAVGNKVSSAGGINADFPIATSIA